MNTIILEHKLAGVWQVGSLFITEKPGRRSLDLKMFGQGYPNEFNRVDPVKLSATFGDAERVLSGEEGDEVCTLAPSTDEKDVTINEVRR